MNNTEEKVKNKKITTKSVLTIVGNVVFYIVIILLFLFSLMNINAGNGKENFPNVFGRGILSVQTSSMERNGGYEPEEWKEYSIQNINAGDLLQVKVFKKNEFSQLRRGDVITFYDPSIGALNTHRIVYISDTFVICQGDKVVTMSDSDSYAFDVSDPLSPKNARLEEAGDTQRVVIENIKGVVIGVSRGSGKILDNIRENWLFYFVIPVAVVLLVEIFFVVKNILDLRNEKARVSLADDKAAMMAELEAERERMKKELMAEMLAQQAANQPKAEPTPAPEQVPEEKVEVVEETSVDETEEKVEAAEESPVEEAEEKTE